MTRKTYILDMTVLFHDPSAIERFCRHDVVIPLIVLEELDKMKYFTDELGKNARHVLRFINDLKGDLFRGASLKGGGHLSIFVGNAAKGDFPLSLDHHKHRILFAAYQLQKMGKDVVILVSKDFIIRLKAEAIGLKAEDYESLKESYDNLYQGFRYLDLPKGEIDELLSKGSLSIRGLNLLPNEYCRLSCVERSSVLARHNEKRECVELLPPLGKDVWGIRPLNDQQRYALDLLLCDDIQLVSLIGQAGTGKTLLALTCALRKVFDEGVYHRILVSRPIMPLGRDIGYLPGTKEEKIYHWMQPIYDNLEFLCESNSGSDSSRETKQWIMESEKIEMEAITFIRGRSLNRTYIIIDEAQNLTPHEVKTIISRAGHGTKVVLTGDPTQIDNPYLDKDSNALTYVVGRFKSHSIYGHVFFKKTERSELAALAADVL